MGETRFNGKNGEKVAFDGLLVKHLRANERDYCDMCEKHTEVGLMGDLKDLEEI